MNYKYDLAQISQNNKINPSLSHFIQIAGLLLLAILKWMQFLSKPRTEGLLDRFWFFCFPLTGSFLFSTSSRKEMQQWTSSESTQWISSELHSAALSTAFQVSRERTGSKCSKLWGPAAKILWSLGVCRALASCLGQDTDFTPKFTDIRYVATDPVSAC